MRWWVGTDVLNCLRRPAVAARARQLDRFAAASVAVAPHLATELASVGVDAEVIPSFAEIPFGSISPADALPKAVLAYLPAGRGAFYGEGVVRRAIERHPDLRFLIVGDDTHALAGHPNVDSLGWVDDMEPVWREVGCVLRVTEHDGLPRMVLEALARGRHAIYSWPLDGCWLARSEPEVDECLRRFARTNCANRDGAAAVGRLLTPPPAERYASLLERLCGVTSIGRRARAALVAGRITMGWRFARLRSAQ